MPAWKLNHLKYKEQLCVKDNDINTQMQAYIKKHRMHYYTENSIQMVEVHVDDIYAYDDDGDKNLPKLGPYGGNTSVRIPEGRKPVITFGQDEAIFRSSQLNESCWQIDGVTTLRTKGQGVGLMASAMVSRAFGFGIEIKKEYLSEKKSYELVNHMQIKMR